MSALNTMLSSALQTNTEQESVVTGFLMEYRFYPKICSNDLYKSCRKIIFNLSFSSISAFVHRNHFSHWSCSAFSNRPTPHHCAAHKLPDLPAEPQAPCLGVSTRLFEISFFSLFSSPSTAKLQPWWTTYTFLKLCLTYSTVGYSISDKYFLE